jgi:hypothetical protein
MDKSELLKKALNKDQQVDLGVNNILNSPIAKSEVNFEEKFSTQNSLLNKHHVTNKKTFIDEKGKNKQVLKNLKKSRK